MFEIFLFGIVISVVLATCITILMNKSKKYILYLSIAFILVDFIYFILETIPIEIYENDFMFLIILIPEILCPLIIINVVNNFTNYNIIKTLKKYLSEKYTDYEVKKIYKNKIISGYKNRKSVGAIKHCYDFHIYIKKYDCTINIYRIERLQLSRHSHRIINRYIFVPIKTVIEYRYDLGNNNSYNKINELAINRLNSIDDINVSYDGKDLIIEKIIDKKMYEECIIEDVESIEKYYKKYINNNL